MFNIRRIYIYVVTAVSLNAVAWALIALLRNLLITERNLSGISIAYGKETMALQLAIIIVGLPIYLAHWLWAERLAQRDSDEQQAPLRLLYLYVMLTAFLTPFIANAYDFVQTAISSRGNLLYMLVAMVVLSLLWAYHFWIIRTTRRVISDTTTLDTIQRLYIYLFAFIGLVMTSVGVGNLLRWLMFQVGQSNDIYINEGSMATALAQLVVGIPLWLIFWRQAGILFKQGETEEQTSALRKFYLYLVIFIAVMGTVGSLTALLAGSFRRLLSLESQGDVRNVLSVLIATAVVWAYHYLVLRDDTSEIPEVQQQAGIRRLYWYLIAGIGLMSLLIGLGGVINVFIRSQVVRNEFLVTNVLPEQAAWFTAVAIAGLLVWIVPWQKIQKEIADPETDNIQAWQSQARKIYLYFYLLLATLTFLSAGIYILSQILLFVIGGRTSRTMASDMAHAIAFALMAVVVWSYHSTLIRRDNKALQTGATQLTGKAHVVVVDDEDGRFGQKLINALQQAIPDITLHAIGLTPDAAAVLNNGQEPLPVAEILTDAPIIVGLWTIATPYVEHGQTDLKTLAAIATSPGHKLLIPKPEQKWNWTGVGEWQTDTAVKQTILSVKQLLTGQTVKAKKGYSLGTAIVIGLGFIGLFVLLPLLLLISGVLFGF